MAAAEREYQNLLDDLRLSEVAYVATRSLAVPPVGQMQQRLPPDTALVAYVIAEDDLSVFVLTANTLNAKTIPLQRRDLYARVELLRDLLERADSDRWRKPAAALAQLLVESVEREGWLAGIEKLYLVPHSILHYLPFSILPRSSSEGSRFLIEDYVVAYMPSSLWEVNDRSTLELMSSSYRHLNEGGKAEALAKAQRRMLTQGGGYRHPYYWAPFVLVGQMN